MKGISTEGRKDREDPMAIETPGAHKEHGGMMRSLANQDRARAGPVHPHVRTAAVESANNAKNVIRLCFLLFNFSSALLCLMAPAC